MSSLIVEQKITAFANQYRVFRADGEVKGELVAFAHQKRLAFKEKIEFFADEARTQLTFTVAAEKVLDVHGRFIVTNPAGERIGAVKKVFGESLLRSTWRILDNDDKDLVTVRERNESLAILRRAWGFVPFIGELPFFLKYHFDFVLADGTTVGQYSKTTLVRDHYRLDFNDPELETKIGLPTLIAQAVLLDALQDR